MKSACLKLVQSQADCEGSPGCDELGAEFDHCGKAGKINQSIDQSINQSINQSVSQSMYRPDSYPVINLHLQWRYVTYSSTFSSMAKHCSRENVYSQKNKWACNPCKSNDIFLLLVLAELGYTYKEYLKMEFEFIHRQGCEKYCPKLEMYNLKAEKKDQQPILPPYNISLGGMCDTCRLYSICLGGQRTRKSE